VPLSEDLNKAWNVSDSQQTLGFVGGGFLASSVIEGLCTVPKPPFKQVLCYDPFPDRINELKESFDQVKLMKSNEEVVATSDISILAVRPEHCDEVFKQIKGHLKRNSTLISFVASKSRKELAEALDMDIDLICKVKLRRIFVKNLFNYFCR
jgi:pyrroline-5-carboxylate reductase